MTDKQTRSPPRGESISVRSEFKRLCAMDVVSVYEGAGPLPLHARNARTHGHD
jgi:hypothetical protein